MNEHDTNTMNELLRVLAFNRGVATEQKTFRTAALEAAQQDPAYVQAGTELSAANEVIAEVEEKIRDLAKVNFVNTQDKHPHPSVQIKEFKTFKIVDPDAVRKWVDSFLRDALVVDEGKVKQYATKIGAVEGTLVGTEIRAEIASKL